MNCCEDLAGKRMRQVVLDTETTGLEPAEGHRIIEIGCVEIVDRKLTGQRFHVYLNPEREIDAGAVEVHGLSLEFLADKPKFSAIAGDLLAFLRGAELIIHNAAFDLGFLNHELRRLEARYPDLSECCPVLDTLALARKKHPGQRNSLDALCKRYGIDNRHRTLHGALLDAEILAEVYLAMTGGQIGLALELEVEPTTPDHTPVATILTGERPALRIIRCSEQEDAAHRRRLETIAKASGGRCLWTDSP